MSQPQLVEKTIESVDVPTVTFQLLTGEHEDAERSAGIFTKEDLIRIKHYVRHGLTLPSEIIAVKTYIGYEKTDIAGLQPEDLQKIFKEIRVHANGWSKLEFNIFKQNIALDQAAARIFETGQAIINAMNQIPILDKVRKKLGELSEQQLAAITYESEDKEVVIALGEILDLMKDEISIELGRTSQLMAEIYNFRIMLTGGTLSNETTTMGLEPQVKSKHNLMKNTNLSATIVGLQSQIDEKQKQIDQLKKDYDHYVQMAFSGLAAFLNPVALIITGGIFGAKAETARKLKNSLINEVKTLHDQVTEKKALQKAIENLSRDFSDLGIRMLDAEVALSHLDYMWKSMLTHIEESHKKFSSINNALNLMKFIIIFQTIITPWKMVGGLAKQLSKAHDEAIEEYKKNYT